MATGLPVGLTFACGAGGGTNLATGVTGDGDGFFTCCGTTGCCGAIGLAVGCGAIGCGAIGFLATDGLATGYGCGLTTGCGCGATTFFGSSKR